MLLPFQFYLIMLWLIIGLIIIIAGLGWKCYNLVKYQTATIEYNSEQEKLNQNLANENLILKKEKQSYEESINKKQEDLKRIQGYLDEAYQSVQNRKENLLKELNQEIIKIKEKEFAEIDKAKEERKAFAESVYNDHLKALETTYQQVVEDLLSYTQKLTKDIKEEKQKLQDLQDKQNTYIKEQQHKEEMFAKKDYYRLNLSKTEEQDIEMLRNLQAHLNKKESIDKLIWEVYYKPAYDILMSHLFNSSEKICGIYKITCLENDKAYIGQSVDIKERFRSHVKTALSCAPSTNKLYQEMKKFQPSNFLFEILEIVPRPRLNEREIYWIDFYKTKDYGLNKTAGGS